MDCARQKFWRNKWLPTLLLLGWHEIINDISCDTVSLRFPSQNEGNHDQLGAETRIKNIPSNVALDFHATEKKEWINDICSVRIFTHLHSDAS